MASIQGNRYLAGSYAEVYWNGIKVLGCNKISLKVSVNREDIQVGLDIDTKITGLKGEGTIAVNRTYSAFESVRREIIAGKDPRGTIVTKLKDPDAKGGQIERYQIGNVALNEFPLEYEHGAAVKSEFPFGFTPGDMICLDKIDE